MLSKHRETTKTPKDLKMLRNDLMLELKYEGKKGVTHKNRGKSFQVGRTKQKYKGVRRTDWGSLEPRIHWAKARARRGQWHKVRLAWEHLTECRRQLGRANDCNRHQEREVREERQRAGFRLPAHPCPEPLPSPLHSADPDPILPLKTPQVLTLN